MTSSAIAPAVVGGKRVIRHASIPNVPKPDFIYLDGPDFQDFKDLWEVRAAVDLLDLESKFSPDVCMVIDGRAERRNRPHEYWRTHVLERR